MHYSRLSMEEVIDTSTEELVNILMKEEDISGIWRFTDELGVLAYSDFFYTLEVQSDVFYEILRREDGILEMLGAFRNTCPPVEDWANGEWDFKQFTLETMFCHFIECYSDLFTNEEYELASEIIEEKEMIYEKLLANTTGVGMYTCLQFGYFEEADYDFDGKVRTKYLSKDMIRVKENKRNQAAKLANPGIDDEIQSEVKEAADIIANNGVDDKAVDNDAKNDISVNTSADTGAEADKETGVEKNEDADTSMAAAGNKSPKAIIIAVVVVTFVIIAGGCTIIISKGKKQGKM
ncbi:MAG: hypothetical protein MJ113_05235 [Lachnospiraceae bacterium]|nr:hypothetical protein [Lachnospiraceae bacterium]